MNRWPQHRSCWLETKKDWKWHVECNSKHFFLSRRWLLICVTFKAQKYCWILQQTSVAASVPRKTLYAVSKLLAVFIKLASRGLKIRLLHSFFTLKRVQNWRKEGKWNKFPAISPWCARALIKRDSSMIPRCCELKKGNKMQYFHPRKRSTFCSVFRSKRRAGGGDFSESDSPKWSLSGWIKVWSTLKIWLGAHAHVMYYARGGEKSMLHASVGSENPICSDIIDDNPLLADPGSSSTHKKTRVPQTTI